MSINNLTTSDNLNLDNREEDKRMWHLHGNILTEYGLASNNRGRNEGNLSTLQKIHWQGKQHTTVSSEAIRAALRWFWQEQGLSLNRNVNYEDPENIYSYKDDSFDPTLYIDDDILGYLKIEKAQKAPKPNQDVEITSSDGEKPIDELPQKAQPKSRSKKKEAIAEATSVDNQDEAVESAPVEEEYPQKPKGKGIPRKGALDLNKAISTTPYDFDVLHSAFGGKKDSTALYSSQCHSTHYQYGFSMTPSHLKDPNRVFHVLDGINSLHRVGGSHSRWLYDFSPNSLILRWTHDPCHRHLYSIDAKHNETVTAAKLLKRLKNGRINPTEVWVAGDLAEGFEMEGVNIFENPADAIEDLKKQMRLSLEL
jgi:CRISPR-associated protein Cst2